MTTLADLEVNVGPQQIQADGTKLSFLRGTKDGALVTQDVHARYYEAVSRGNVYMAANQTVVTFGTAFTATGVTFHLCNPIGSKMNLVVLQASITVLTGGTAGHICYVANTPSTTAVTTGTPLTVQNALLNGSSGVGQAKGATTLPAVPTAIRPWVSVLTIAGVMSIVDYIDGAICVAPGAQLSVQGLTVVGTGLIGMIWEEVAISA